MDLVSSRRRITVREARALRPGQIIWDDRVIGLGARRQAGSGVSYLLRYRTKDGRQRTYTIGRHGSPWDPDSARIEAIRLLGLVARGEDPSGDRQAKRSESLTVSALCDQYLEDAEAGRLITRRRTIKRPSTIATDRSRIEAHIRPLLGSIPVAAVTRMDLEVFMRAVAAGETRRRVKIGKPYALSNIRGGTGAASRTLGLLGAILNYAVRLGVRESNPAIGIIRPADGRRDRRLSDDEYRTLGRALVEARRSEKWSAGIDAILILALTGWRRGEVLSLRWTDLALAQQTAVLPTTKTGRSIRPLGIPARDLLAALLRQGELVFRARSSDAPMQGFASIWRRIVHRTAGLSRDVTPHVLRHSYASVAADIGLSDAVIAGLLGHAAHSVTRRYVHLADATLIGAANQVAARIAELLSNGSQSAIKIQAAEDDVAVAAPPAGQ